MPTSGTRKLISGLLAFAPIVGIILILVLQRRGGMGIALVVQLLGFVALIYFIIDVVSNASMESSDKVLWIVSFFFCGGFSIPIYWLMHIMNDPHAKFAAILEDDDDPLGPGSDT